MSLEINPNENQSADSTSKQNKSQSKNLKKYSVISQETRENFIKRVLSKEVTIKEAARQFNIKFSTSKAILHIFKKEGRIGKKQTRERKLKLHEDRFHNPQKSNRRAFQEHHFQREKLKKQAYPLKQEFERKLMLKQEDQQVNVHNFMGNCPIGMMENQQYQNNMLQTPMGCFYPFVPNFFWHNQFYPQMYQFPPLDFNYQLPINQNSEAIQNPNQLSQQLSFNNQLNQQTSFLNLGGQDTELPKPFYESRHHNPFSNYVSGVEKQEFFNNNNATLYQQTEDQKRSNNSTLEKSPEEDSIQQKGLEPV